MDYITSKVFVIAIGIFVTLTIVTGVILVFTYLGDIYGTVENMDTSIINQFDNMYSMYSGAEFNTIGLLNTIRKYEQDDNVVIQVSFVDGEEVSEWGGKENLMNEVNERLDSPSNTLKQDSRFNVLVKEANFKIYILFQKI